MQSKDEVTLIFILKENSLKIPFNIRFLNDVNQDIFNELTKRHEYEVKSNVNRNTFISFINHWTNQIIPIFTEDNINDFESLSKEFGRMEYLIELYKNHKPTEQMSNLINQNQRLKQEKSLKKSNLQMKTNNFQKIIQILSKSRGIDSHSEFQKIKPKLFKACQNGNIEEVEFLTRKKITKNDVTFILNENDQTASILSGSSASGDLLVPLEIEDDSKKYVITSISKCAFKNSNKLKSIQFPEDSQLKFIGVESFADSRLEKVTIPRHVTKIDKFAFFNCSRLKKLEFQSNSELSTIEESSFSDTSFESIVIPQSVSRIEEYAFYYCNKLKSVTFSDDSKLTFIGQYAFGESFLERIKIPPRVSQIGGCAFMNCHNLRQFEICENSELKCFEIELFTNSALEFISIPSSIVEFKKGWCSLLSFLKDIKIIECKVKNVSLFDNKFIQLKSDMKSDRFDTLIFARRNLKYCRIPPFIKIIHDYAFNNCLQLEFIQFDDGSQLNSIGIHAFSNSAIEKVSIPSNCECIQKYAFNRCTKIDRVCFDVNSELKKIEDFSFASSKIASFSVPSKVDEIGNFAFSSCNNLQIFEIHEDSKLKYIDLNIFKGSMSVCIMIPVGLDNIINQQI